LYIDFMLKNIGLMEKIQTMNKQINKNILNFASMLDF
jgi:hypothetical protein